jgi:5-methylcytosine-specific restriction endonuclease McrA
VTPERRQRQLEATRRWRARNPDRVRELDRKYDSTRREKKQRWFAAWYEKNAEQVRVEAAARMSAKWAANPEGMKAQRRAAYARDPAAAKAAQHRRRALFAQVENTLTAAQWREILVRFDNCCAYCGRAGRMTLDHVVPLSKGGGHTAANVVPACRSCNSSKRDRLLDGAVILTPPGCRR